MTAALERLGSADARARDGLAAIVIAGFLVARLAFAVPLGPGIDESYTLAISRTLALSYFDHPPLHQWIAHAAVRNVRRGRRRASAVHSAVRRHGLDLLP